MRVVFVGSSVAGGLHLGIDHALLVTALLLDPVQTVAAVSLLFPKRQSQFTLVSQPVAPVGVRLTLIGSSVAVGGPAFACVGPLIPVVGALLAVVGLTVSFQPADPHLRIDLLLP